MVQGINWTDNQKICDKDMLFDYRFLRAKNAYALFRITHTYTLYNRIVGASGTLNISAFKNNSILSTYPWVLIL